MKPKTQPTASAVSRLAIVSSCLSAALLAACGGGGGTAATPSAGAATATTPPDSVSPNTEAALAVSTPGSLVDYFKQKLKLNPGTTVVPVNAVASPAPGAATADSAAFSSTTLQERDVDENDWVKTDGVMVYGLARSYYTNSTGNNTLTLPQLQVQRRQADGQLQAVGRLALPNDLTYSGMYLVNAVNQLALVGQKFESYGVPLLPGPVGPAVSMPSTNSSTSGTVPNPPVVAPSPPSLSFLPSPQNAKIGIDLLPTPSASAATTALSVTHRIRIDGNLVGSRVIGSTLYVVSNWSPNLSQYAIPANATPAQADAVLAKLSSTDILPTIKIDDQPSQPLMAETDCYVQAANASPQRQITTITAFNLASPNLQRSSRCFLGGSQALYVSPAAVYVASSRYINFASITASSRIPASSKTDIHKFALSGAAIDYRGTGEVAGHLGWDADKNAYRMSEYQGDLRVLTFTGQQGWSVNFNGTATAATPVPAASPATLTVLREATGTTRSLQTVATLPNAQRPAPIGKPGEQIYAVQYTGARAYVVTFKRTDPLYVLDLTNPSDPKTLGELEIPGYSDYLYPLGTDLLLGVGKDANDTGVAQGVKVALMDVSDPTKPSIRGTVTLGKRGSASGLDISSRGINIFQQGDVFRIGLPVRLNETPIARNPGFFSPTLQGLARFEVDSKTKTLTTKPTFVGLTYPTTENPNSLSFGQYDLAQERSVQIGSFVYYFSGGSFLVNPW
jgi:hypothetical protein